jgi:hypothetical protein
VHFVALTTTSNESMTKQRLAKRRRRVEQPLSAPLVVTMAAALATYAACQTGCNAAWVACCAALGYTAGTYTAGSGVPAALATCSAGQGTCMAGCAAMAGLTGVAEVGATAAAAGTAVATSSMMGVAGSWRTAPSELARTL